MLAADPVDVAARMGARAGDAQAWVAEARLATLRGIGDQNVQRLAAVGVHSVPDLAGQDPALLARELRSRTREEVLDARIRVWVRAARRQVGMAPLR